MQKKPLIIILSILVIVMAGLLLFYVNNQKTQKGDMIDSGVEITPGSGDNLDVLETENRGEVSLIRNTTHNYSIISPNSWSIENQTNSIKIYPRDNSSSLGSCIFVTAATEKGDLTAENIINRNIADSLDFPTGIEIRNVGQVSTQNHTGLLQRDLEGGKIISETVYIESDSKIYSIGSAYGHIHGYENEADYDTCHPLFEDLLESFTIN